VQPGIKPIGVFTGPTTENAPYRKLWPELVMGLSIKCLLLKSVKNVYYGCTLRHFEQRHHSDIMTTLL